MPAPVRRLAIFSFHPTFFWGKRSFPKSFLYCILTFIIYPVIALAAGYLGHRAMGGGSGAPLVRFALLVQCVLIACLVPFFSSAEGGGKPIKTAAGALLKACGVIAASSFIAITLSIILGGPGPLGWAARSAAILAAFAVVLIGISAFAGRLGAGAQVRQVAALAGAAVMLGTVFYANPAVAAARGKAKVTVVRAAVAANPLVCVAGSALDYDIMISRRSPVSFYHQSLIGPDHLYRYPRWWLVSAAYLAVGLVFLAVSLVGSAKSHEVSGGS